MSLFRRMLENEKAAGIKCSSDPAQDILRFKLTGGKDFLIFNGPDEYFIVGRLTGVGAGLGGTYGATIKLLLIFTIENSRFCVGFQHICDFTVSNREVYIGRK